MIRVFREDLSYFVGPDIKPAMEIPAGSEVVFETVDCFSEKVQSGEDTFASFQESLKVVPGWNPITGPVFIKGAHPGDFLAIDILDIRLPDRGRHLMSPDWGCSLHPISWVMIWNRTRESAK